MPCARPILTRAPPPPARGTPCETPNRLGAHYLSGPEGCTRVPVYYSVTRYVPTFVHPFHLGARGWYAHVPWFATPFSEATGRCRAVLVPQTVKQWKGQGGGGGSSYGRQPLKYIPGGGGGQVIIGRGWGRGRGRSCVVPPNHPPTHHRPNRADGGRVACPFTCANGRGLDSRPPPPLDSLIKKWPRWSPTPAPGVLWGRIPVSQILCEVFVPHLFGDLKELHGCT